ncbi:hypothetical protein [Propionibacterium freudenreichii]|uniref:hypothetical protein n=1 Tax=Propionibacterium freudenreichii TaxID=1744 RepID=UPI0012FDA4AE|nr:hypothetical protein [Propionibacterium freudenreichii]
MAHIDHGPLRHGTVHGVTQHEVTQTALGIASDAVDARDQGQLISARVVRSGRLRTHPGMEPHRHDVDNRLMPTGGNRIGDLGPSGW